VSSAGPIRIQLDSVEGASFWVDDQATPADAPALVITLQPGRHVVTIRVDTKARSSHDIKVEVTKPVGSPAEFSVVGGR
jgi:hypothetical protein